MCVHVWVCEKKERKEKMQLQFILWSTYTDTKCM